MFPKHGHWYVWPTLRVVTTGYPVTQQEFKEAGTRALPILRKPSRSEVFHCSHKQGVSSPSIPSTPTLTHHCLLPWHFHWFYLPFHNDFQVICTVFTKQLLLNTFLSGWKCLNIWTVTVVITVWWKYCVAKLIYPNLINSEKFQWTNLQSSDYVYYHLIKHKVRVGNSCDESNTPKIPN